MTEQIISKTCRVCKETKPISEFCKRSDSRTGHRNDCKTCRLKCNKAALKRYAQSEKGKAAHKRYRQNAKGKISHSHSAKRYRIHNPKRSKAKAAVMYAIKTGRLPRPDSLQCHYCPARATQYHHWKGYEPEHWLDVVPVCVRCHGEITRKT